MMTVLGLIDVGGKPLADNAVMWQLLLHLTFVLSALLLAVTDRISTQRAADAGANRREHSHNSTIRDGDVPSPNSSRSQGALTP